jgi:hypothetical protein
MSRLNVGNLFNENEDGAPVVSGISTFSSPHYFVPPSGSTAERPQNPGEGMIRFNTDSGHLEYYTGTHWADVITNNNELGDQNNTNSSGGTGTRGVVAGGYAPGHTDVIKYFTISTLGNTQDFGTMVTSAGERGGVASDTRGIFAGGAGPGDTAQIEFITFASTGNGTDFASDLTQSRRDPYGCGNQTRGLFNGGYTISVATRDTIDFVTIASTGTIQDFGNLTRAKRAASAVSSSVRGVVLGGFASPVSVNDIDYYTISSTGNAQNFGDLTTTSSFNAACASSIRGLVAGGEPNPAGTDLNTIEFITIATTGNSQDFGDLTYQTRNFSGCSSVIRGVFMGGDPKVTNMDYVTIAATGNALDFGDLNYTPAHQVSISNGHGGL